MMFPCNHSEMCEDCRRKTSVVDSMENLLVPYIREQAAKNPFKASRGEVLHAVSDERDYQAIRWPGHRHEVEGYLTYIRVYLRKAEELMTFSDGTPPEALEIIRKITALGVACLEEHGVKHRALTEDQKAAVAKIHQEREAAAAYGRR